MLPAVIVNTQPEREMLAIVELTLVASSQVMVNSPSVAKAPASITSIPPRTTARGGEGAVKFTLEAGPMSTGMLPFLMWPPEEV